MSDRPTDWIQEVSVENFTATAFKAAPEAAPIWLEKSFSKKFQSPGVPATLYMATRSAESTPFLRNLRPSPGARGYESDGSAAEESLTSPCWAPSHTPVKGWAPLETNLTFPTTPTEWIYLVLVLSPKYSDGIWSPGVVKVGPIASVKIPASSKELGKLPEERSAIILFQSQSFLREASEVKYSLELNRPLTSTLSSFKNADKSYAFFVIVSSETLLSDECPNNWSFALVKATRVVIVVNFMKIKNDK
jgi:hypothetical protein